MKMEKVRAIEMEGCKLCLEEKFAILIFSKPGSLKTNILNKENIENYYFNDEKQ